MKLKKIWFAVVLLILVNQMAFAQHCIKGKITDKANNQPLSSVNVYAPEQHKGALSDTNGIFCLNKIPKGTIKIQFSYVGYKTIIKTVTSSAPETMMNIQLERSMVQTEEVVVSGAAITMQHDNAIKIDILKSAAIAQTGDPSFIEAIAQVPGVDVISKGVGVSKPVIRGLSMSNILMLNNGVKLENFQFSENHPFIIDEFGTDGVEIIKGPASLLYGSDAVGGVINVIHEKPAPVGAIIGDFNAQYFSNTEGVVTNLGVKGSSESLIWGVRAGLKSHTDYRDGNGDYVPNTRFNDQSFKANVGLRKKIGLFQVFYDYDKFDLGMCVENAIPLVTENSRKNDVWYQDLTNHIISSKNRLFLGDYKIDLNAAYQMNNRKLQTDNSTPAFELVDMDMNTLSYELKTYLPAGQNAEYIIGFQGANKTNRNHQAPEHVLPDADVNDLSLFGVVQHTFFDQLKAEVGIRYDYRHILTVAEPNKVAIDNTYGDVSASLGATYKLNSSLLLRANLASAHRTPNIAELTENGMHGSRYEQGDPNLKSQRSYEADVSAHLHSKKVMIDLAGFYHRISNYIFLAPTNDTIASGDLIYRYSQVNAVLYGAEISVSLVPVDWMNIDASYSYVLGKEDGGEYLPFIPQNKLRTELKFQKNNLAFLEDPFVKVGALYAVKQSRPAMFETASDSYFLLNAGVGATIQWANQLLTISIQANNLLNETYIDHLSTLKGLGYNNIGRNISVNVKIPFGIKM